MTHSEFNRRLLTTPTIANEIVDAMPAIVKECCGKFEDDVRRRDVFLTACLAILSAIMPKIWGRYDVLKLYPNLYFICIAPPGSGKGIAVFARKLLKLLHDARKADRPSEITFNSLARGFTVTVTLEKRKHGVYIPANTSAARFLQQLSENGGEGLLFETEIDTLVSALGQDWGGFSHQLREAFQHESISCTRKTEAINIEIEVPKLSMFLTGTPNQLLKLIPSSENGLFSRNWFYCFKRELSRINVKPKLEGEGLDEYFFAKGEEVKQLAAFLEAYPAEFKLRDEQWEEMNSIINETMFSVDASHGSDANSLSMRFGVNMFRLVMILSAIRKWERRDESEVFYCSDEDFRTAISLSKLYMEHTLLMLEALPKSNVGVHINGLSRFFSNLPSSFTRIEAVTLGAEHGFSPSKTDRNLKKWAESGKLSHTHGRYQKPEES